jgi:hypothetical protein
MSDRICGKINECALEAEQKEPDNCHKEGSAIDDEEIIAGPVTVEIDDKLNCRENCHDHGKEDHRRHHEEAQQVGNTAEEREDNCLPVTARVRKIDLPVLLREEGIAIGQAEDGGEQDFCDMVIDVTVKRDCQKLPADNCRKT